MIFPLCFMSSFDQIIPGSNLSFMTLSSSSKVQSKVKGLRNQYTFIHPMICKPQ
jgi:hypothetical protein